jgi:hypothetical protein
MAMNRGELPAAILGAARMSGLIRPVALARGLGIKRKRVESAVDTLVRQGKLNRVDRGVFEYVDPQGNGHRPAAKTEAVWRAMRLSPTWTTFDIARLAGTSANYVHKLVTQWKAAGLVEIMGNEKVEGTTGVRRVYRLRDRNPLQPPTMARRDTEDPLKKKAWQALGRVLFDRVALPGERDTCCRELREILEVLEKGHVTPEKGHVAPCPYAEPRRASDAQGES